jgi:predicted RNA binding protein YcfA (HicA-like mRNA interferase family)
LVREEHVAKARQVRKALQKSGWTLVSIRGSHHVFRKDGRIEVFAYHDTVDLGGPRMAIVAKQFGLTVDQLRRLL